MRIRFQATIESGTSFCFGPTHFPFTTFLLNIFGLANSVYRLLILILKIPDELVRVNSFKTWDKNIRNITVMTDLLTFYVIKIG
ncbi:hypothetical protein TCA2_1830 [Paenibacillus sp. TCA20]|nr:hypothetical protein TCA2_1830 [Paenibacillus sp. TCA20]